MLRAGSGSGRNFVFSFGSSRARDKIFMFTLGQAGPSRDCNLWGPGSGLKNPGCADLAGVTLYNGLSSFLLMCEGLSNYGGGANPKPPPSGYGLVYSFSELIKFLKQWILKNYWFPLDLTLYFMDGRQFSFYPHNRNPKL